MTNASIAHGKLIDAILTAANLSGADLTGVDLSRADLTDANLSGANLCGATNVILSGSGWQSAPVPLSEQQKKAIATCSGQ